MGEKTAANVKNDAKSSSRVKRVTMKEDVPKTSRKTNDHEEGQLFFFLSDVT